MNLSRKSGVPDEPSQSFQPNGISTTAPDQIAMIPCIAFAMVKDQVAISTEAVPVYGATGVYDPAIVGTTRFQHPAVTSPAATDMIHQLFTVSRQIS